ncbi:Intracellular serine protease [Pelotomaculum schinkii]|uniref:Intracellular serine protease n=1 Tax=Pelotomaculum schinkii TaxID=78350 RepID=A0A4Y7RCR2_9FIRM|nr:kelch repeat-containing protein [Pelotomaculum schinkii]TEB06805.1 Intracellular serine protease [Pelotomaculum schinkii]
MKKAVMKMVLSLFLALSLTLTTTSLPLSVNANYNGINEKNQKSNETGAPSIQEDVYAGRDENGNLDQDVADEVYAQMQFDPLCPLDLNEYKTDRFIVKYKSGKSKGSLAVSLGQDLKEIRNINNSKFKSFNVITTKTKMRKEDFIAKVKSKNAESEIEYIQPDYELTAASLDAEIDAQQNEQDITDAVQQDESPDNQAGQASARPGEENLPEFLQGLPPNDPMVEQWLTTYQAKKEAQKNTANAGTPVNMADVNIKAAWGKSQGEGAIVAILDTGIDITHKELSQRIWTNKSETPGNGTDDDGNGYIDDTNGWNFSDDNNEVHRHGREYDEWHGTHLAGIIAGAAPEAKILPLKVFKNGTAYTSDIIEAIEYAEKNGAKIANCSWGTSFDNPALKEAIANSTMLFVCAAGNSNADIDTSPVYPASYGENNIITVASINKDGNLSGYSNYGETSVDVSAQGENIVSATPGDRHGMSSGTSQSAAFVSAEAALILGACKNAAAEGLKQIIIQTSDKLPSLLNQVSDGNKINCGSAASTAIPEKSETLIREDNNDISVSDSVYEDISVTDSVYGETIDKELAYGNPTVSDTIYQTAGEYSLYSGEIWNIKASMPTPRFRLAAAEVNGKIYAIGGEGSSGYLNTVEEYDPATNTWTTKASMPTPRDGLAAAAVNGKIYAIGGGNYNGKLNTVEEYDPATNTWAVKASMPTSRFLLAAAAVDGKIYAIGGNNSGLLNAVEEYNPATNTWTAKASMPTARNYLAVTAVNGKIYAIGGFNDTGYNSLNTVEEYNPATNTWTAKTGMPMPRFGLSAAAANGKIYAMGGRYFYDDNSRNVVEEYTPATNTWRTTASMPTPRHLLAAAAAGNRIYAIGGANDYNILNAVEELVLGTDDYGNDFADSTAIDIGSTVQGWIDYANDVDCFNFTPAVSGSYIIESLGSIDTIGELYDSNQNFIKYDDDSGDNYNFRIIVSLQAGQTYYIKTREYSDGTGPYTLLISNVPNNFKATSIDSSTITVSWDPVPDAIGYDIEIDGAVIDNGASTAYIHSGLVTDVTHIYRIRVKYNATTGGWSKKVYSLTKGSCYQIRASMPTPRGELAAAAENGKVYVIGGFSNNWCLNTVEEYNPATDTWVAKVGLSTPRYRLAAAAVNGKIYALGGYSSSGYSNTVEEYNPVTNTWTAKAGLSTPRYRLATAAINGKIYALGGYSSSGYSNTLEEYDPATNTWTVKAAMPTPRYGLAAAAVNGKIYAIGGYNSSGYSNHVEEYDPATNTWTVKAAMPTPRHGLAAAAVNGKIYVIGGYNSGYLNQVEEYDPATNTWSTKLDMPIEDNFLAATALNGRVYAIGGHNSDGYLDYVQELNMQNMQNGIYTINTITGDTFNLAFSAKNMTVTSHTFTVTYDPAQLQLLDPCGQTPTIETELGLVSGTNVTIVQNEPGTIVFSINNTVSSGKSWSGLVNTLKFKANVNNPAISYKVT